MKPGSLFTLPLLLTVSLALLPTLSPAAERLEPPEAKAQPAQLARGIQFADDSLTVKVTDMPLTELLQEIASQSGLTLVLPGSLQDRISVEFHQLPLKEGLRRILRHQNFALEYAEQAPEQGQSTAPRPTKLWILSRGDAGHPGQPTAGEHPRAPSSRRDEVEDSPVLEEALLSDDAGEREEAVKALGASGGPEAVGPLSLALADEDEDVREAAIAALADLGGEAAAEALAAALEDQDRRLRNRAVEALQDIGGEAAAEALGTALEDQDRRLRNRAVEALQDIGGEAAAEALGTALHDEDGRVRQAAVEALEEIGGEAAAQTLAIALRDQDASLREAAVEALGEIGGQSAMLLVRQALADPDESVRDTAADTLEQLRRQIR